LLVADLFHLFNHFAVEVFLNGNVRHRSGGRGAAGYVKLRPVSCFVEKLLDNA
jgi:hypothetical protein